MVVGCGALWLERRVSGWKWISWYWSGNVAVLAAKSRGSANGGTTSATPIVKGVGEICITGQSDCILTLCRFQIDTWNIFSISISVVSSINILLRQQKHYNVCYISEYFHQQKSKLKASLYFSLHHGDSNSLCGNYRKTNSQRRNNPLRPLRPRIPLLFRLRSNKHGSH